MLKAERILEREYSTLRDLWTECDLFQWGFDEDEKQCCRMKLELLQRIMELRQQDVTQFFVACDYGIGLYAAEQINDLRKRTPI